MISASNLMKGNLPKWKWLNYKTDNKVKNAAWSSDVPSGDQAVLTLGIKGRERNKKENGKGKNKNSLFLQRMWV